MPFKVRGNINYGASSTDGICGLSNELNYDNYTHAVNANSILVENKDGYDEWNTTIKSNPERRYLWFLPGPYHMYKAAYNDTIVVIKDGYVLKFKMPTPDTVSRKDRFWRD